MGNARAQQALAQHQATAALMRRRPADAMPDEYGPPKRYPAPNPYAQPVMPTAMPNVNAHAAAANAAYVGQLEVRSLYILFWCVRWANNSSRDQRARIIVHKMF